MAKEKRKTFDEELARITREHGEFDAEAYRFVFEALDHLLRKIRKRRHVSGAELADACRELALDRFGLLARTVLNQWGVHRTSDFGKIVFHLVQAGLMSKTEQDKQSDFENVYDFEQAFDHAYRFPTPGDAKDDPQERG